MLRPDGMDHSQKFMLTCTKITLSSIDTQRRTFQCLTTATLFCVNSLMADNLTQVLQLRQIECMLLLTLLQFPAQA